MNGRLAQMPVLWVGTGTEAVGRDRSQGWDQLDRDVKVRVQAQDQAAGGGNNVSQQAVRE